MNFSSHLYIHDVFADRADQIRAFTKKCMEVYSNKFHVSYPSVTLGELKFVKNKAKEHGKTKFIIGIKLGLVLMMVIWIVADHFTVGSNLNIWDQPGLYVYTIVGNMLLYRVLLA
eukprot:gene39544-48859_t